jgi:predicted RND superfamily exporter protein
MTRVLHNWLLGWHALATRHRWLIMSLLLIECLAATAVCLQKGTLDSDIWSLFSPQDPVVAELRTLADRNTMTRSVFIRLDAPSDRLATATALREVPHVESVVPLPPHKASDAATPVWLQLILSGTVDAETREMAVTAIRSQLDQADTPYGLTGTDVVMQEFKASIWRDFGLSSLISLLLVCGVVAVGYRLARGVWIGLLCELGGLLAGLAIFLSLGGVLNVLSATVPCVLVGLGVDFVIHSVSAATRAGDQRDTAAGLHVYQTVLTPMFWGALTTALAFFSLCLAKLTGLRQVGLLGGIGMLAMFVNVVLFLPPMLSRYPPPITRMGTHIHRLIPRRHPWRVGLLLALACLALLPFARRLHMEERIDELYDPALPSLAVQNELAQQSGTYPSMVFAAFESRNPAAAIRALQSPDRPFVLSGVPTVIPGEAGHAVVATLAPRQNPFIGEHWEEITAGVTRSLPISERPSLVVTGDAQLTFHLNDLLATGMRNAFILICGLLVLVLILVFRRPRVVVAPIAMFLLAIGGTAGLLGLLGVSMSAYTLSLFPLFIGIGVDDCFHVSHVLKSGRSHADAREVLLAITMTSLTTLAAYGSLMAARNPGFHAMGLSAIVGLSMMYIGAIWMLPAFFLQSNRSKIALTSMENRS